MQAHSLIGDGIEMIIGATSWQIRGTYLENVEHIQDELGFCELLVYTWDKDTRSLLSKEIERILKITEISVHMPTDNLENCKRAFDFFKDMDCINMTLHPFDNFKKLADFYFRCLEHTKNISVENLENNLFYEFGDYLKNEMEKVFITMDYGHLLFDKRSIEAFYNKYGKRIKEIHFHGANEKKAHVYPDKKTISDFKQFIEDRDFVDDIPVCIELFEWEETKRLVEELKRPVQ